MRLIIKDDITDANYALAIDEALWELREKGNSEDTIFIWKPPRFIYIPRGSSILYIDRDIAENAGYPVKRSDTLIGKPESSIIVGSCWNVIAAIGVDSKTDFIQHIMKYGFNVWKYVAWKIGLELEKSGNDLVVKDTDRKIVGFGVSDMSVDGKNSIYTNTYISNEIPPDIDINNFFILTDEKFEKKTVSSASERISSIKSETGNTISKEDVIKYVTEYFNSVGVTLEEGDFTEEEINRAQELIGKHQSEDWIKYARTGK